MIIFMRNDEDGVHTECCAIKARFVEVFTGNLASRVEFGFMEQDDGVSQIDTDGDCFVWGGKWEYLTVYEDDLEGGLREDYPECKWYEDEPHPEEGDDNYYLRYYRADQAENYAQAKHEGALREYRLDGPALTLLDGRAADVVEVIAQATDMMEHRAKIHYYLWYKGLCLDKTEGAPL